MISTPSSTPQEKILNLEVLPLKGFLPQVSTRDEEQEQTQALVIGRYTSLYVLMMVPKFPTHFGCFCKYVKFQVKKIKSLLHRIVSFISPNKLDIVYN